MSHRLPPLLTPAQFAALSASNARTFTLAARLRRTWRRR